MKILINLETIDPALLQRQIALVQHAANHATREDRDLLEGAVSLLERIQEQVAAGE